MTRSLPRIILLLALVMAVLIALAMRFLNEDLFVALCAGRDVVQGKLGQPDTWAFTTDGKVWVNQGWLSHLLLYLSYQGLEDLGPVLWKTLLLLLCVWVLYIRCRRLGASTETALVAVTIGTLSIAPFLQIRPENFGVLYFILVTTLLTAPRSWGLMRQAGTVLVMLIWVNSHWSFVLGLAVIGLKLVVESIRATMVARNRSPEGPEVIVWREPLAWGITAAACVALAAVANPFGTANLFMPHRQLSAESVTRFSADWVPLLDWRTLSEKAFFHPLDVRPFLAAVALTIVLAGLVLGTALMKPADRTSVKELPLGIRGDVVMDILIPLFVVELSFPFRRIILFAGVSLVPLLALLMYLVVRAVRSSRLDDSYAGLASYWTHGKIVAAVVWLLVPAIIFIRTTLPPYLPGNPTRADRPLVGQLMSFDSYTMDAVHFMRRNEIHGRLFPSWVISDFLLFHAPGIQVFMDCRDQSAYSDQIIQTYFATLSATEDRPASVSQALEVLDRYKVTAAVIETRPAGFRFATVLMATRKWACVYKDEEVFVLVPVDSRRFGSWLRQGDLPPLWYPNETTRTVSAALLRFFMTAHLTPETRTELERIVQEQPDSSVYGLLYLSALMPNGCLRPELKPFFLSEVKRLSAMDPMTPRLGKSILESLIKLLSAIEGEDKMCSPRTESLPFEAARKALEEQLAAMERKYLGYTP